MSGSSLRPPRALLCFSRPLNVKRCLPEAPASNDVYLTRHQAWITCQNLPGPPSAFLCGVKGHTWNYCAEEGARLAQRSLKFLRPAILSLNCLQMLHHSLVTFFFGHSLASRNRPTHGATLPIKVTFPRQVGGMRNFPSLWFQCGESGTASPSIGCAARHTQGSAASDS